METTTLYALAGIALFGLGLHGLIARAHLVAKILALNVMSAGVFMLLIAIAARGDSADPVPHALVLTGIVVAVSATALALVLVVRVRAVTGQTRLPETDSTEP
jgi:multicomponent Na+:H+ antiporter subunit C